MSLKTGESSSNIEDLTIGNLTAHVIQMSTKGEDSRVKYLTAKLIQHLHDFVRDVELQTDEWEVAWQFLTRIGQTCTPERQEFVLLSDVLGVSALVDAINSKQTSGATESSVLGPFFSDTAKVFENGESITSNSIAGEPMLIRGAVLDTAGKPIPRALVDIWETDGNGFYDMQDVEYNEPDCRGKFFTDTSGKFYLKGVKPVDYPIPNDGPVGEILQLFNRDWYRPAHVHYMIMHPEYEKLVTAVYSRESKYIIEDPVFGTKKSLVVDFVWTQDEALAKTYGISPIERIMGSEKSRGFWLLERDFVLVSKKSKGGRKINDTVV
ncbi:dioxygenase [Mollisia scopiformis]|uniref:Dioxygenase n=1 Tax=Mollisia scopiformis TaxID=149040 RepID=A0A194XA51_MOLSC|nr:dioxygenase [Mollisia scopiformis]KUJ17019.1 dioxygenase [Mollisia scopiformis]